LIIVWTGVRFSPTPQIEAVYSFDGLVSRYINNRYWGRLALTATKDERRELQI